MKLRDRIENNLVVWLLGTLLTGFMAGIGTYKAILDIAQLEVVSRAKLEMLQQDLSGSLKSSNSRRGTHSQSAPSSVPEDGASNELVSVSSSFALSASPPFPEGLDSVKPGMTLSTARSVFPDGEMRFGTYLASINSGLFRTVAFLVDRQEQDPIIHTINIFLRDESSMPHVLSVLLRELDEWPHRTEMLGERLVWPDVNGYRLEVEEDAYTISAAGVGADHE